MDRIKKYLENLALRHTTIGQKYLETCNLNAELLREMKALESDNERLRGLALTDGLTGLHNRRYFDEQLEEFFWLTHRHHKRMSLALIDIDNFKSVNDSYGHLAGDSVLQETAERILQITRETDITCRYGGEEFGVVMPFTESHGAFIVADKVRHGISDKPYILAVNTEKYEVPVTVSIGLATYFADSGDPEIKPELTPKGLVKAADTMLYQAKRAGKNRVVSLPGIYPASE